MKGNKATTPLEAAMKRAREGVVLAQKEAEGGRCEDVEDPGATLEDETRAALDLRRALGEPTDPLAALEAAERALLVAGGWRPAAREGHWLDAMQATWPRASAVVLERERVARLATKAGAS